MIRWCFQSVLNLCLFCCFSVKAAAEDSWRMDWVATTGFSLEIDTEGYDFPSAIAFVPNPGPGPKDPIYFVTELRGKVARRDVRGPNRNPSKNQGVDRSARTVTPATGRSNPLAAWSNPGGKPAT